MSEKSQEIDPVLKCAVLVAVVSGHTTTTKYAWEKKDHSSQDWVDQMVPADTCILYARSSGMYRCLVAGEEYQFEVKGIANSYLAV